MSADTPPTEPTPSIIDVDINDFGQAIGTVERRGISIVVFADSDRHPRDVHATGQTALSALVDQLERRGVADGD